MIMGLSLIVVSLIELWLGCWFFYRYQKNQAIIWYGLFTLAVALYVGANGLGSITDNYFIHEKISWVGGILTAIFFLPFSFSFPIQQKKGSELVSLVFWPAIIFTAGIVFSNSFINEPPQPNLVEGYQTSPGELFWLLITSFFGLWIWSLSNLVRSYKRVDGIKKSQTRILTIGVSLSLLVSIIFDIFYPLFTVSQVGFVGSLFTSIWLFTTSYIIIRKN